MATAVLVEYTDIYSNTIDSSVVGLDPTITLTNPGITSTTNSYSVFATLLTEVPLYSTIILSAQFAPKTPTNTITSVTGSTLQPLSSLTTIIAAVQVPSSPPTPAVTTSSANSTSSSISSASQQASTSSRAASSFFATSSSTSPGTGATTPPAPPSNSISTGAIVGAAVGCLIGGALIAGLLVWLVMSSRHKKQRSRHGFAQRREDSSNNHGEKSLPAVSVARGTAVAAGWEQHLPQSESDSAIRTSVKALFDQIETHVENFYRNAAVSISPEIQAALMKVDSTHLPDAVVGLLPQTKAPTMLIKHCLAQLIVSRISSDGDTSASFLPTDFVVLPRAIGSTRTNANKPAFAQALSRWRVLSSYLRPRPGDDRIYLGQRDAYITAAAESFCTAFAPWATSSNNSHTRRQHLINLMKAAADTGIVIFAQPSNFAYRWTLPSDRDREGVIRIVVLPGFAKVTDEHARDLGLRAQELVAPTIGTL